MGQCRIEQEHGPKGVITHRLDRAAPTENAGVRVYVRLARRSNMFVRAHCPVIRRMRLDKRYLLTESFPIRYQERADSSAAALSFSRRHPTSPETPQIFGLRGAACSSRIGLYPQGVSTRASVVLGISPAKAQTWLYENGADPHHGVGAASAAIRETSAAKRSRWLLRKTTSTMSRGPMI
jgi:hypothetical protein